MLKQIIRRRTNTKSVAFLAVLVLTLSISMPSCAKTRGNEEAEKTVWADMTMPGSRGTPSAHLTQYFLTLMTEPPGIASPTGEGWYDSGTNVTVSTQEFIDISPGQSRYKFNGWTAPEMSEINDPALSTTSVLVDKTKTVTANYVLQYRVFFEQSGTYETPHEDTIVQVDGVNYYYNTMPASFWYDNGSSHAFHYETSIILVANKKAYVWANTTGLSTQQIGSITVSSSGNITGNYKTQFYLNVASQHGTPSPASGWFDPGSEVVAFVSSPVSGDSATRYICTGWTGTGNVPASGQGTTTTFTITQGSRITWNWKTQFLLTVSTSPADVSPQPGMLPTGEAASTRSWWYETSTNVTLTAEAVANATFDVWNLDGASQGQAINPVSMTMNAPHTAIAHYITGLVGDTNADRKVDMRDVGYVARRFTCVPSDALWNSIADFNADGKIDMKDISTVAKHFGEHYP